MMQATRDLLAASPPADPARDRLGIYRTWDGWMISYAHSSQRAEIVRLFETTELPLPFTAVAAESTVRDTLAQQQPDVEIYRLPDHQPQDDPRPRR